MPPELEIHRLLVLSLSHLTPRAAKLLIHRTRESRSLGRGIHCDKFVYGFHLILAEDDPEEEWLDPSIRDIVTFAREHNCTHVRMDDDGPEVEGLQIYE